MRAKLLMIVFNCPSVRCPRVELLTRTTGQRRSGPAPRRCKYGQDVSARYCSRSVVNWPCRDQRGNFSLILNGAQPKASSRPFASNPHQSSPSPRDIPRSARPALFPCAVPPARGSAGDHTLGPRDSVLRSTRRYTEKRCHHAPVSGDE